MFVHLSRYHALHAWGQYGSRTSIPEPSLIVARSTGTCLYTFTVLYVINTHLDGRIRVERKQAFIFDSIPYCLSGFLQLSVYVTARSSNYTVNISFRRPRAQEFFTETLSSRHLPSPTSRTSQFSKQSTGVEKAPKQSIPWVMCFDCRQGFNVVHQWPAVSATIFI